MMLKCIVIEDEPPAMELITRFIEQTPFLNLAGRFFNALEGLRFVQEQPVDLIFLDIRMPDISGIELARILSASGGGKQPAIIFTTAFDQFAIEGYKLNVIDYLLKPFEYEEFFRAANKAVWFAKMLTGAQGAQAAAEECLYVKVEYQIVKVPYRDIVTIEGLKDYAVFYLNNPQRKLMSLVALKTLEDKLPADRFMRIHRSVIIAVDKITSLSKAAVHIGEQTYHVTGQYRAGFNRLADSWQ